MMRMTIIGANGMLSAAFTKFFYSQKDTEVFVYGLDAPKGYNCHMFRQVNLLSDYLDYDEIVYSDIIIYASGAGVQSVLNENAYLMYQLNVNIPINITLKLKEKGYKGVFMSFGSYMEIGANNDEYRAFSEEDILQSTLPVLSDYAISKRVFSRYISSMHAGFVIWHFILPNLFSYNDITGGTRLIPYVISYLKDVKMGLTPPPPHFSTGSQIRQFVLLEEIPRIVEKAIEKNMETGVYNVGGGDVMTIRESIELLFKLFDVECSPLFFGKDIRRDDDIKCLKIEGRKLLNEIGFLPNTHLCDILNVNK